jgi:hypothetical protein
MCAFTGDSPPGAEREAEEAGDYYDDDDGSRGVATQLAYRKWQLQMQAATNDIASLGPWEHACGTLCR